MSGEKKRWEGQGDGVYKDNHTGKFYHRPVIDGRATWRLLDVATLTAARALKAKLDTTQTMHAHGMEKDPYAAAPASVGELIAGYKSAGCPLRNHQPRSGIQLDQETSRIKFLEPFWKLRRADQVKPRDCFEYAKLRKATMRKDFTGNRAIDMELATLTCVFNWAVFNGALDVNPLTARPKFRDGKKIRHCRDSMPQDGKELQSLARALFEDPRSEALGWQLLLEAMTGCRTSEVLRCRWDAKTRDQAGFIDGSHLWLNRSKSGVNPFVEIHPALDRTLRALAQWRAWRQLSGNPWFIPSHRNPGQPIDCSSLTHALKRIGPLIAQAHRTSHGLRAFYVTVRRSMGIADALIAAEIGDVSGAAIIVSTYGAIPANWQGGKAIRWDSAEPAWTVLGMPENILPVQAHA